MIKKFIISIGANMCNPDGLSPLETCKKAIQILKKKEISLIIKSDWYLTDPMPISLQPKYVNCALYCKSYHTSYEILKILHEVESYLGRIRILKNMARCIDLDLIDYDQRIRKSSFLVLPHPRMHLRKFVLLPLRDIKPRWHHPKYKKNISYYLKKITKQKIVKIKH